MLDSQAATTAALHAIEQGQPVPAAQIKALLEHELIEGFDTRTNARTHYGGPGVTFRLTGQGRQLLAPR